MNKKNIFEMLSITDELNNISSVLDGGLIIEILKIIDYF